MRQLYKKKIAEVIGELPLADKIEKDLLVNI